MEPKELKCYLHPFQISFSTHQKLRREVRLMNPYKFDLHFTVKSTAPEQYIVAPPNGVLHAEKAVTFVDQSQQTNLVDRFRVDIRSADGTQSGVGYFKAKHGSNGSRTVSPGGSPSPTPSLSGSLNLGLDLELIPSPLPPPPSRPPPPPPPVAAVFPSSPAPAHALAPPANPRDSSRLRWIAVALVLLTWSLAHAYFRFSLLLRLVLSAVIVVIISLIFRFSKPPSARPRHHSPAPPLKTS